MKLCIPNCPEDTEELIESQIQNRANYIAVKKNMTRPQNISYYEYQQYPNCQFVIVDDKMYWELLIIIKLT